MNKLLDNPFPIFLIGVTIIASVFAYNYRVTSIEMAKLGLQECRVEGHILWQRECK